MLSPFVILRHRPVRIVVPLLAATLALAGRIDLLRAQSSAGSEQEAPAAKSASLSVTARLVVLDIVVTDNAGNPVDGLTANDFQVFEDDKPQRIRSVEPPSAHSLPAASLAAGASAIFDPARPDGFGRAAVDVLVLDQLNTHFADSSFARRALHDYLTGQPAVLAQPTTLLSVYENRSAQLQAFTRDRDALLRALAATPAKYAWTLEINGKAEHGPIERLDQSLRALEEIAQSYARIPGRKNLIWVGGGFPTLDPTSIDSGERQEIRDTLEHVTDVLLDTRVTMYAVDPSSSAAGMTEIVDMSQQAFADAAGETMSGGGDPFLATEDFDKLGPVTGGRVLRGMNDVARQIASSADLGASFYTLAYTPTSSQEDATQYRRIRIVLRPGLTATTRGGYYSGQTQQEKSAASAAYDLSTAAGGAMPLNGLRVTVEQDMSPDAPESTYVVHTGAANLTWKPSADGGSTASVYVMAVSLSAKNKMLGHTLHGMTATAKAGTDLSDTAQTADFQFTAPPAPKSKMLRFIVRDSTTGRMGSFDLPLAKH